MEPFKLQRLIDNELDASQRQRLLQQIDHDPIQWRTLALALLEEQAFQREIASCTRNDNALVDAKAASQVTIATSDQSFIDSPRSRRGWGRLALAASLFLTLGYGAGYGLRSRTGIEKSATFSELANAPRVVEPQDLKSSSQGSDWPKAIGELHFVSDDGSENQSSLGEKRVPLFEVRPDHIQRLLEQQARQVHEWNQSLNRRGLEVEWQPEVLESRLPDGRAVIVPVNQWNVRPIGQ